MPRPNGGDAASGWMNAIVPAQPDAKPADFNLAEGVDALPRASTAAAGLRLHDVRLRHATRRCVERWSKLADAKDPDLSKFRKRGGKVIMTYGWADPILQPLMGVNYYERAVARTASDTARLRAAVHGARHGALRRRHRARSHTTP